MGSGTANWRLGSNSGESGKGARLGFNRHGVNTLMTPSPPECQEKTTVIRIPAFGSVAGVAIYLDWLQGVLRYNLQCLSPIK